MIFVNSNIPIMIFPKSNTQLFKYSNTQIFEVYPWYSNAYKLFKY